MKPKTKFQKEVSELSKRLPSITETQKDWAYKHLFDHTARATKKGIISCLECGNEWTDKGLTVKSVTCPHCGAKLKVIQTRKHNFKQIEYFCIIAKYRDYQVLRFFYMESLKRKGAPASYTCTEVVQRWIDSNGKYATLAMLRPMSYWIDSWQWTSRLEIRHEKNLYDIMPTRIYPKINAMPILKRNGLKNKFYELSPFELIHALLTNNRAETLYKTGQTALLKFFVRSSRQNMEDYWQPIRIAIRYSYIIEDGSIWCDYIDLLRHFGKDICNPKYVCPSDLKTEHDRLVKRRHEQIKRERILQDRLKAIADEEHFRKLKERFFGINFSDGLIQVNVLDSVNAYLEEGVAMHHCVFSNKYYMKPDSLILSATIDGKRVETVEVSLSTLKVLQSRGVCNSNTEYHERIIKLVNRNKKLLYEKTAS